MSSQAELIIVPPRGEAGTVTREFIGRCILYGIDFYFEDEDKLPASLPVGLSGVRAIVHDNATNPGDSALLDHYRSAGARVYVLDAAADPTQPNARGHWRSSLLLDMLAMDAGLTLQQARPRAKLASRDDKFLFESMGHRLQESVDTRWYDATRYQWEGLLDAYELTGDEQYLKCLKAHVQTTLATPNPLDNCDTVAPLLPLLRLYEFRDIRGSGILPLPPGLPPGGKRQDAASTSASPPDLLRFARDTIDRYLKATPRYDGCLVNFDWLAHTARSEIIWQVCPTLAYLYEVTGESRYLEIAIEQYEQLSARLQDPATGLWRHGVSDRQQTAAFWARGAAFVLLGLIHLIEHVPASNPARDSIQETIRIMADRLCQHQQPSGFWFTVIDHPDTEFESSGTAWIGAALERGMRLGILPRSYRQAADQAWAAVKTRIWQGGFPGHNTATTVSPHREYYLKSHLSPTGWTHFAFRLACERRRRNDTA